MLDELFTGTLTDPSTLGSILLILGCALGLGLLISIVYRFTHRTNGYSASFSVTLIMLPAIIAMIIVLVGNNVARAFSLAGAFSLIRFRSAPGDSKDIAYVFFTLGVGLACGMGFLGFALLFTCILCLVMILLEKVHYGQLLPAPLRLKIQIPEELEFSGVFEPVLKEYSHHFLLKRIKTTEFGSLFELSYDIQLDPSKSSKEFIDRLRTLNGNLQISLTMNEDERNKL